MHDELDIAIMGIKVHLRYTMHEKFIEWWTWIPSGDYPSEVLEGYKLLDQLLRLHYCAFIENKIREHYHWESHRKALAYPPDEEVF